VRNVATGWFAGGDALQASLQDVAKMLGDRVLLDHAVTTAGLADGWVAAGAERFRAKALLIASGTRPEHLAAAPAGAFGGDVTYEIESDPDRFKGRPVLVIGGGDSATLDALALAPTASSVMLAHRGVDLTARHDLVARLRADKRVEDLPGWELDSLHGDDRLQEVTLVNVATGDRRTVPAGGVVVKISRAPDTGPFSGQLDLDHRGFVVTDRELRTSHNGVFAAGDVVSGAYWRVSSALGQGSLVSRSILDYLQSTT
jgi:thioredoxin reductase (NADPH)